MSIPSYEDVMLPLLQFLSDDNDHKIRDAYKAMADHFELTADERAQLLPSGKAPVISNRTQWAKLYLLKAGLIESPKRGVVRVTERGRDFLRSKPAGINNAALNRYPEFAEFLQPRDSVRTGVDTLDNPGTPDEQLQSAYRVLRNTLAQDLLTEVKAASPAFFERLVVDLLLAMGYGGSMNDAGQVVGGSGDGGIDGVIKEDRLGLDVIYVQAKRWETVVSRPEIQKFVGALQGRRAKKGVFITSSGFSQGALDYVQNIDSKVVLIDGRRLAEFMIDFDIGVSRIDTYVVKRVDTDYFADD